MGHYDKLTSDVLQVKGQAVIPKSSTVVLKEVTDAKDRRSPGTGTLALRTPEDRPSLPYGSCPAQGNWVTCLVLITECGDDSCRT